MNKGKRRAGTLGLGPPPRGRDAFALRGYFLSENPTVLIAVVPSPRFILIRVPRRQALGAQVEDVSGIGEVVAKSATGVGGVGGGSLQRDPVGGT